MILIVTVVVGFLCIVGEIAYSGAKGKRLYGFGDTVVNLSAAAFEHVFTVLVATPVYALYVWAYEFRVIDAFSSWVALPISLVLMDGGFYFWHRTSHRVAILWSGHAIHHSSEEFNFSVAVRSSGWAKLTQRVFYLPMAFVGIPISVAVLADAVTTIYALFLHNRFVPRIPYVERVFVTPSHHRVHHARNPEYIDKNFAAMFIFWDRLFGTYQEETVEPVYGLSHPLDTHNVGWARFHVIVEIFDRMKRARSVRDTLLAPFLPPGWNPELLSDGLTGAVTDTAPKARIAPRSRGATVAYAVAQHALLFVAIFAFTYAAPTLPLRVRVGVGVWLCASLAIVGALLDSRRWAGPAEALRWALALGLLALHFGFGGSP